MTPPADGAGLPVPWQHIFLTLAQEYNWTPQQVGSLTFAQVWLYWNKPNDAGPVVRMPLGEATALIAARAKQRRRWIDEQMEALPTSPE